MQVRDEWFYADTGCEEAPRCLACHLPMCKYDDPPAFQAAEKATRDARVIKMFHTGQWTRGKLAQQCEVSIRTIDRILDSERRREHERTATAS